MTKNILPPKPVDPDVLRAITTRRLAFRLGLTMPVAALVVALADLGPNDGRRT